MDTYNLSEILENFERDLSYDYEPKRGKSKKIKMTDDLAGSRWYMDETDYDYSELEF